MLFNSYAFVFLFLPAVLLVFLYLERRQREAALTWLVVASLFFYAWWKPVYLLLLLFSMVFNFAVGSRLQRRPAGWLLAVGVAGNLALLGWFKYANFVVDTVNALSGTQFVLEAIILPLAISFFTFQQIAWLVDARRGQAAEYNPVHYALFVCFFPQLIAGPIVHHAEMMPQFARERRERQRRRDLEIGLTIFFLGFLKKVVLADTASLHANPVFDAAARGELLSFFEAWGGALAYSFQLYFDFSGYSDMAIGLGRLFGIRLPVNFFSPYRAGSIIEFWRRWHITLARFLRDYLYIPLGGNRKGRSRTLVNLMLTMLLGGLWHGAAWTFVFWGGLHGAYLVINRLWRDLRRRLGWDRSFGPGGRALAVGVTFLAAAVGWVVFRAESFPAAARIYAGMAGLNGAVLPPEAQSALGALAGPLQALGIDFSPVRYVFGIAEWGWLLLLAVIAFGFPNIQQLMARYRPGLMPDHLPLSPSRRQWRPHAGWALGIGLLTAWALLALNRVDEFLYFQF
ncbi:MAG: MBOAT family protein [Gammaproteobacteria bacterium]|nr:MBOAT family protein [Gammaproteobacteria bacterium]